MPNSINGGVTNFITLKEFLKKIPIKTIDSDSQRFNTLVDLRNITSNDCDSIYLSKKLFLVKGEEQSILLSQLSLQISIQEEFKKDAIYFWEDAIFQHMEMFGCPNYLVRLAPRTWLVANPEDYVIYKTKDGKIGLTNEAQVRGIAHKCLRITKEEAMGIIKNAKS